MLLLDAFFAYASDPPSIGTTIEQTSRNIAARTGRTTFRTWRSLDICGYFIANQVLSDIDNHEVLVADITRLNFNVLYEIGYAIGKGKPIFAVKNSSLAVEDISLLELGIFDTIGYLEYKNSDELTAALLTQHDVSAIDVPVGRNSRQPIYSIQPKFKTEFVTRIESRINKTKLAQRKFDPIEQARLAAFDAIQQVSESYGVLVPLLASEVQGARLHNLRASFVAGLAEGMGRVRLLLQHGNSPVPIDYRDLATTCYAVSDADAAIAAFAADVTEQLTSQSDIIVSRPEKFLQTVDLGSSTAENELRDLASYYLETSPYQRVARGEARIVVGRKGSGKSAIFLRARDKVRRNKSFVVLGLKPEGYQLRKFRDSVVDLLNKGSQEHLVMAFWEYVIYLEVCAKIIESDKERHLRDPDLYEIYNEIVALYGNDAYISEGDFSDRLEKLASSVAARYADRFGGNAQQSLSAGQVTDLVYHHDLAKLREVLRRYLISKGELWIFLDNIDKGWPSHGIESTDMLILRTLLEATRKIEREFDRHDLVAHTIIFLRNDVYELLLEDTPDRGKETRVAVDWSDVDLLKELIRLRLARGGIDEEALFEDVWRLFCTPFISGEESAQYLIDRCLMRPRALIDLLNHCRSVAINLKHDRVEEDDVKKGLNAFSNDLVIEINLEIRDIFPAAEDVLYMLIGTSETLTAAALDGILSGNIATASVTEEIIDVLLWHGVLGLVWPDGKVQYIFDANYNLRLMKAQRERLQESGLVYQINPAFWPALLGH
ncbi:nucleoside 2-deoxyribosyltransferase [Burkholderia thailandensis]|nr:hypothetical protein [Burkholderia thailandensis]MCS3393572.1 nucleoside 2-deoxyribosyltransferase [Burkholderia thailandensis]MCS6426854.1 nucleoside 2-deoxyribosyltransferase [Burkholderia thailandensis]MCS6454514.1 nucleoside 2-deoxyribosyltransferase [Burkholderia thailandensis]MCS6466194.1 nucleoside 2-deoxyribosyltransferase [Burkholderia thailandensis]MCS6483753.1 nucleoside 2-deoxyribosyltransferase [Burkholderia thailandensis]